MPPAKPAYMILPWLHMESETLAITQIQQRLHIEHSARYFLRIFLGIVCGAAAALFLAWFMHYLIQSSDLVLQNSERNHMLDFVRVKRSETVQRKDRAPERPKMAKSPEVPQVSQGQADSGQQLAVAPMAVESNIDIGGRLLAVAARVSTCQL